MGIGSGLYEIWATMFNQDEMKDIEFSTKFPTLQNDIHYTMKAAVLEGLDADAALSSAKAELLNTAEKVYYFEHFMAVDHDFQAEAEELYKNYHEDYSYTAIPDYSSAYSSAYTGAVRPDFAEQWGKSTEQKSEQEFKFDIHLNTYLDGDKIEENVTSRSTRNQTLSNGY